MFGFQKIDREVYKQTFLRKVFVNVHYSQVSNLNDKFKEIKDLFVNEFPRASLGKNKGFQFSIQSNNPSPNFEGIAENDNISLKSQDGQAELLINNDNINFSIEGKSYESFENNIEFVLQKTIKLFNLLDVNTFKNYSLRKINLIEYRYNNEEAPNGILEFLLNKALVYNDDAFPCMNKITQNIHTVDFEDEQYLLNIKYGMNTFPSSLDEKVGQLIVDLDIHSNKELTIEELDNEFKTINSELYNVFYWMFNDKSKKFLKDGF